MSQNFDIEPSDMLALLLDQKHEQCRNAFTGELDAVPGAAELAEEMALAFEAGHDTSIAYRDASAEVRRAVSKAFLSAACTAWQAPLEDQ